MGPRGVAGRAGSTCRRAHMANYISLARPGHPPPPSKIPLAANIRHVEIVGETTFASYYGKNDTLGILC